MKVSLIVPVYNEERYIERCLGSIADQSRRPDEVIVVNDGSTDASRQRIQNSEFRIQNLIVLSKEHQGPAAARNLGGSKARGKILVFLDADMVYDSNFIEEMIKPIEKGMEVATFTTSEYVGNFKNRWARFWDIVGFDNQGKRVDMNQGERGGAFRAISAREFKKVGGYESGGFTDDATVLEKLKVTAADVPTAVCYHFNPETLEEVFYSARWMGRDPKNRGQTKLLIIFSPVWSLGKGLWGGWRYRSLYFVMFRIVFDWGYWWGVIDVNIKGMHYK